MINLTSLIEDIKTSLSDSLESNFKAEHNIYLKKMLAFISLAYEKKWSAFEDPTQNTIMTENKFEADITGFELIAHSDDSSLKQSGLSCYAIFSAAENKLIVAIKGTYHVYDYLNNIILWQGDTPLQVTESLYPFLELIIDRLKEKELNLSEINYEITGHSLGGAYANYAANKLYDLVSQPVIADKGHDQLLTINTIHTAPSSISPSADNPCITSQPSQMTPLAIGTPAQSLSQPSLTINTNLPMAPNLISPSADNPCITSQASLMTPLAIGTPAQPLSQSSLIITTNLPMAPNLISPSLGPFYSQASLMPPIVVDTEGYSHLTDTPLSYIMPDAAEIDSFNLDHLSNGLGTDSIQPDYTLPNIEIINTDELRDDTVGPDENTFEKPSVNIAVFTFDAPMPKLTINDNIKSLNFSFSIISSLNREYDHNSVSPIPSELPLTIYKDEDSFFRKILKKSPRAAELIGNLNLLDFHKLLDIELSLDHCVLKGHLETSKPPLLQLEDFINYLHEAMHIYIKDAVGINPILNIYKNIKSFFVANDHMTEVERSRIDIKISPDLLTSFIINAIASSHYSIEYFERLKHTLTSSCERFKEAISDLPSLLETEDDEYPLTIMGTLT